jgi:hypothetical protein
LGTYLAFLSVGIEQFDKPGGSNFLSEEIGFYNWNVAGAGQRRLAGDGGGA